MPGSFCNLLLIFEESEPLQVNKRLKRIRPIYWKINFNNQAGTYTR